MAPDNETQQIPEADYYSRPAAPVPSTTSTATSTPPAGPTPPLGPGSRPQPRRDGRVGQTLGAALIAAVLASGGTYALTHAGEQGSSSSTTPTATATTNTNHGSAMATVRGVRGGRGPGPTVVATTELCHRWLRGAGMARSLRR